MLSAFIGIENVKHGVLKKHSYSNTVDSDLWNALQRSSGIDVAGLMHNWTKKPIITVTELPRTSVNNLTLNIIQESFICKPEIHDDDGTIWVVPIQIRTHLDDQILFLLNEKSGNITIPYDNSPNAFYVMRLVSTEYAILISN